VSGFPCILIDSIITVGVALNVTGWGCNHISYCWRVVVRREAPFRLAVWVAVALSRSLRCRWIVISPAVHFVVSVFLFDLVELFALGDLPPLHFVAVREIYGICLLSRVLSQL